MLQVINTSVGSYSRTAPSMSRGALIWYLFFYTKSLRMAFCSGQKPHQYYDMRRDYSRKSRDQHHCIFCSYGRISFNWPIPAIENLINLKISIRLPQKIEKRALFTIFNYANDFPWNHQLRRVKNLSMLQNLVRLPQNKLNNTKLKLLSYDRQGFRHLLLMTSRL